MTLFLADKVSLMVLGGLQAMRSPSRSYTYGEAGSSIEDAFVHLLRRVMSLFLFLCAFVLFPSL
jgi:hypothetical protein